MKAQYKVEYIGKLSGHQFLEVHNSVERAARAMQWAADHGEYATMTIVYIDIE